MSSTGSLDAEPLSLPFMGPMEPRVTAPFQGLSHASREASKSGAEHAEETRSANIARLLELWREPHTMHEIAALSHLPLSSVCSLKAEIEDRLIAVGFQRIEWEGGRRSTKRTRWQLATAK